jgi:hypothetical protein
MARVYAAKTNTVKLPKPLFLVVFVVGLLVSPLQARADDAPLSPEQTKAAEIKKRGDEAMESGRPADALTAYTEAYALSKDPALLFNKGRALQALGEYPQALNELDAFDKTAPPDLKSRVPGLAKLIDGVKQKVTTITITCDVDRAQIRLRDRTIGRCPMIEPIVVNAGKGRLEVTADGYFPWTRDLDLPAGGTGSFEVHLSSKATMGIIVVKSNVANTVVSIDGKPIGQVPAEANLDAGTHEVTLSHEGYEQAKRSAVVFAGERRELDVPMQAEASILKKWWFWTAAGVVVLTGVAVVVIATSEKSPEPGTVPPGVVKGGLTLGF